MSIQVNFVTEDNAGVATWQLEAAPVVGQQVHKNYSATGTYEVIRVQWSGNNQMRVACVPVEPG